MAGGMYMARSGHLSAMAEFLARGINTAIPEVDEGDDVWVCQRRGREDRPFRVQVKTATGKLLKRQVGYTAMFVVPRKQLLEDRSPELYYVLAVRIEEGWEYVVISREDLLREARKIKKTPVLGTVVSMPLIVHRDQVLWRGQDLQPYRNNWSRYWPAVADEKRDELRRRTANLTSVGRAWTDLPTLPQERGGKEFNRASQDSAENDHRRNPQRQNGKTATRKTENSRVREERN